MMAMLTSATLVLPALKIPWAASVESASSGIADVVEIISHCSADNSD